LGEKTERIISTAPLKKAVDFTFNESAIAPGPDPVCFQNAVTTPPSDSIGVNIEQTSNISGSQEVISGWQSFFFRVFCL